MINLVLQTPSLQHLAAVKTVAALWNHPDILKQLAEQAHGVVDEVVFEWSAINRKVNANALTLELTEPCKQRVLNLIQPLGQRIFEWCGLHYGDNNEKDELIILKCTLPNQFCRTMHGIVDYAKTAQLLVKDERVDLGSRYEIACANCLEDVARELIAKDGSEEHINRLMSVSKSNSYIAFFTFTLRGDTDRLNACFQAQLAQDDISINLHLFISSLCSINRTACEYFFNKLNQEEKELVLGDMASTGFANGRQVHYENLLYLLPLMSEDQRERLFGENMGDVLVCLLEWPCQLLFMEALMCGWLYIMLYHDYEKVLDAIARKISAGAQDYPSSKLFRQCWSFTPADVQRRLLDDVDFLDKLLETDREEIIVNLLLNEAPLQHLSALVKRNDKLIRVLMEESVISDAALMECKEKAAWNSSNHPDNAEKRLRSECLSHLVDAVMRSRSQTIRTLFSEFD